MASGLLDPILRRTNRKPTMSWADQFSRLEEEMERLFGDYVQRLPLPRLTFAADGEGRIVPHVDMSESADAIKVVMDVPGIAEKDIEVALSEGALVVSGKRESKKEEEGVDYFRAERSYGEFKRRLSLPCDVKEDKIEAVLKDGVLTITLPKTEKARQQARKIEVRSA